MIGRITGIIIEKQPPQLLIDVQGIGYEIFAPMSTFYVLPELKQSVTLHTHLSIRDDAHVLYGFAQAHERTLFRSLIKVNGVGPKLALTILSGIDPDTFVAHVQADNSAALTAIPGIGAKTAKRLIMETRDALKDWTSPVAVDAHANPQPFDDALNALIALGYKNNDARKAIQRVAKEATSSEDMIRLALKEMH